jgi:tetratricopeptide (TPR) repeat protein
VVASNEEEDMDHLRRHVLQSGIGLLSMAALGSTVAVEEFLPQCTSGLQVCWHLMRGKDLALAERLLNTYTPTLTKLTLIPSAHQQTAASLATQAKILQAILVAEMRSDLIAREMYCHEAVQYSLLSSDSGLIAVAKKYLASTYTYYIHRPDRAVVIALDALHPLKNGEEQLVKSDLYMGLANAYAQQGEEQKALEAIGLAEEYFPEHPELDPREVYAGCSLGSLYRSQGRMYLDLGEHQQAYESFSRSAKIGSRSQRGNIDTFISQAEASIGMRELEQFSIYLREGALKSRTIGSKKLYNEALTVFKRTPKAWKTERPIVALKEEVFASL